MSAPDLTGAAAKLAAQLPTFTKFDSDANNWAGHLLCGAIGAILDAGANLTTITEDTDDYPGWTIVTSPEDAPAEWLPWQADLYGVDLIIGQTTAQDRTRIADLPAQKRGTPAAMIAAVRATLTGTQSVYLLERVDAHAYRMALRTIPSETLDSTATATAARQQKPAAVRLATLVSDSPMWDEAASGTAWDDIDNTVTWDSVTLDDVEA